MGFIESLSMSNMGVVVTLLGWPGLFFIVWLADYRRIEKQITKERERAAEDRAAERERTDKILKEYKNDVERIARMYENNVILVENYQKLSGDLAGIIHLNTQTLTNLVNATKNNMFCPVVRKEMGQ